ncbi:hypothetical protein, partial [Paracoccus sp. (in: a-proteobacteria)]|uniref:hypothetical protein n=1 Tax=Paracoccus sp. TaxID=267 RepID=UPI0033410A37
MPDTFTPRLNLTKPEVGASDETWGDKINANSDAIDTQVVRRSGDTMTGNLAMGNNKITGLAAATNAGDAPRFDQVLPQSGGNVSGFIRVPGGSESAPSLQFSNENNG